MRTSSVLGQATRSLYRHGGHRRPPYPINAKPWPARDAIIGTRENDALRGHDGSLVSRENTPVQTPQRPASASSTRPTSRWTAYTDGPSGPRPRVTTRSHHRPAKPLPAHVSCDAEPLSARQAPIGTRARQREPLLAYALNTATPLSAPAVRVGARDPWAMPISARQAIIGPRDTYREPSSTPKPLSALG